MTNETLDKLKEYLSLSTALKDAMRMSLEGDDSNVWKYSSYKEFMRKYNMLVKEVIQVIEVKTILDLYDLEKVPSNCDTIAIQQKHYFDSVYSNLSILESFLKNKSEVKNDEIKNLKYFIQSNLRKVIFSEPQKETEVQNAIEQLFIGKGLNKGIDYGRETGRVNISIKEVVPDFVLYKLNLALEVKLSKTKTKSKEIVDEINADILAYGKEYSNQLFVVYDLGSIRDEEEFKNDLDNESNIQLIVIKH
ncbi:hypothetical protein E9993_16975 [Labilibacter sediminis]|nr:hypothetical protein E9993_16975 [Labilibacter sediminis]